MCLLPLMAQVVRKPARIAEVGKAIKGVLVRLGLPEQNLADDMGLDFRHLSRQINSKGVNLARLVNAGTDFWRELLRPLCAIVGLTDVDVRTIFAVDGTEAEELTKRVEQQEQRLTEQQTRIDQLETLVRELVERHPAEPAKELKTA